MKKLFLMLIAVLFASGLIFSGCAQPQVKPAPSPSPAPTPAPTPAPQKPIELKLSHHMPPAAGGAQTAVNLANRILEKSKGMLKINVYPAESLVKHDDSYDACVRGIADMVVSRIVVDNSRQTLSGFCELPGLNWPNVETHMRVISDILKKYPEVLKEHEGTTLLSVNPYPSGFRIHVRATKEVRVPSDLKGLKMHCWPLQQCAVEGGWGAVPVIMPNQDIITALERGMVDGTTALWSMVGQAKYYESLKSHVDFDLGTSVTVLRINSKLLESLPADLKNIVVEESAKFPIEMATLIADIDKKAMDECRKRNQPIITPTGEDLQMWLNTTKTCKDEWVKLNEDKGKKVARELLNETERLVKQYSVK